MAIAAGGYHSLALDGTGAVWTWGDNEFGQLGDGTTTNRFAPVTVSGLSNVVTVAAGQYHSLALDATGIVWAWGRNDAGQLGDGTTTDRPAPVQVGGLSNVVAIAAGEHHSVALCADGTIWAWGANDAGQLGDGSTTEQHAPIIIHSLWAAMPGDPTAMCSDPWAHGLTNRQVFNNPSVLRADNYSTLGDGVPDWLKVQCGVPVTATMPSGGGSSPLITLLVPADAVLLP